MSGGAALDDIAQEDYRRRFRELLRVNSGMLMNVLESAAGAEDKELLRSVVEAAFFIFSGDEGSLPGGKDFWTRMRTNISPSGEGTPAEEQAARWKAVGYFRRELDRYASDRPDIRKALEHFDRLGRMPAPTRPAVTAAAVPPSPRPAVGPGPGPSERARPPAGPPDAPADNLETETDLLRPRPPRPPAGSPVPPAAPPYAQVILPSSPAPPADGGAAELRARLGASESELAKKDSMLRELDGELRRLREQLGSREETPGSRALEEKLLVHEEEARMARSDLAKLEKKYRENLELLKEEARDRGSLQKHLDTSQGEVARAQERLKDEQEKLADARRRLEKRERELETLEERHHSMELELVRKEEEIKMAMQHLRDEEAERRRVLDALRQEARDKAQMEHRLKRREEELSRLETRIVEEETRISALKGSQAISEEDALRKAGDLKRREEEVRALESTTRARLETLRAEEDAIKERVAKLKLELRGGEVLEAQLAKREELRAALEARYRQKEEELVRELRELERLKAGYQDRDGAPAPPPVADQTGGEPAPPAPRSSGEELEAPPFRAAPMMKTLVVANPPEPENADRPGAPTTPVGLFPAADQKKDRSRDELLDLLAKKKKSK